MALNVCLPDLLARKKISQATFDRMKPDYDELVGQFEQLHGRAAAESMATEKVLAGFELDHVRRKRQALLQAKAQGAWLKDMQRKAGADADGKPAPLRREDAEDFVRGMDYDRQGIERQAFGMIEGLLGKFRRNLAGVVRHKDDLADVLDELHGKATGNANAKELAEAWTRTAEWLRSTFNANGGHIARLEGWALPQLHDQVKIADAGFAPWREFILPLLNREKMIDHATGLPMADGKLELMLKDMHQAIATDGWSRREAGQLGVSAVGNRRQAHRVLHFKDGASWAAYAERFGGRGTGYDAMIGHVRSMARDIAAIKWMGPNPKATLKFQQDWLLKSGAEYLGKEELPQVTGLARIIGGTTAQQVSKNARRGEGGLQRLYNEFSGANSYSENPRMTTLFGALAAQQTSAKLGGALISAVPDFGSMLFTAGFNDLPMMKMAGRYAKLMAPGSEADRSLAARLGVISEQWTRAMSGDYRLTGEELTHETTRRLADFVLRASLLERHTEATQQAFGMELMGAVSHLRGKDHAALPKGFAAMLERYNIGPERWDQLRATPTSTEKGMEWIMPADVQDEALRQDLFRMVATEVRHAVTVADLDTRAMVGSLGSRGRWITELTRSAFLFKSFPLSLLSLHGRRMMRQSGLAPRLSYAFGLVAMLTTGGAISQQLTALRDGKDPEQMWGPDGFNWSFGWRAMLKGGGMGIFGDLINSNENRFGGGMAASWVGPILGQFAGNVARLTIDDPINAMQGEDVPWQRHALDFARSETPGLSLWYVRAATERLFMDYVREAVDGEGYAERYGRMEKFAREQDTSYHTPPGAFTGNGNPARGIDWGNAIGMPGAEENVARIEEQAAEGAE